MMERIYKWVLRLITGEKQDVSTGKKKRKSPVKPQGKSTRRSKDTATPKSKLGGNNIDITDAVIKMVLSELNKNYRGSDISFTNRALSIYITDSLNFDSVNNTVFIQKLSNALHTEKGYQFASINVNPGPLVESQSYTKIDENIFIQVVEQNCQTCNEKSQISTLKGFGSMVKSKYVLDCANREKITRWNIGVGRYPQMANDSFRENYIAIDDNEQSPQFENNKYVSRSHANITYHRRNGFLLNVEVGGTRQSTKRTRIFRNGETIEVDCVNIPEVLHDGDIIELSKHVRLLFQLLK